MFMTMARVLAWLAGDHLSGRAGVAAPAPDVAGASFPMLVGDDSFMCECTGESYRWQALQAIARNEIGQSALVFCMADLVPEPLNPHDANAVGVWIEGAHVAFIPKGLAPAVGAAISSAGLARVMVRAVITKGLRTPERYYSFRVELDFDPKSPSFAAGPRPAVSRGTAHVRLPSDGSAGERWRVWLDQEVLDVVEAGYGLMSWTTPHWDTVNFYAENEQRIGLGYCVLKLPKRAGLETFSALVEKVDGRFAEVRLVNPAVA